MDQSTQVNFPIVKHRYERSNAALLRKQLSYDTGTMKKSASNTNNSWLPLRPQLQRPKSLNLSTETYHRSRISFMSETSPKYSSSDASLNLSRERTPPPPPPPPSSQQYVLATTTTTASSTTQSQQNLRAFQSHNRKSISQHGFYASNNSLQCRCFDVQPNGVPNRPNTTAEGLSWRRLHMSRAKLKATSTTSELLSGFAMVAMVELQISEPTNVPEWLFIMFAICTTVLVSVHIFALMISTYILPNIDAISKLDVCELVAESPHERMRGFIELAWAFSTVLGLFLFLVEVAILCWVKFWDYSFNAAIAATVIVIPVLVIFVLFAVHFYHSLVVYRCDTSESDLRQLEELKRNLDEATTPV